MINCPSKLLFSLLATVCTMVLASTLLISTGNEEIYEKIKQTTLMKEDVPEISMQVMVLSSLRYLID